MTSLQLPTAPAARCFVRLGRYSQSSLVRGRESALEAAFVEPNAP
jgi:hypothetical protein